MKKNYPTEIAVCIGIVSVLELAYYLANDDDFSLSIYAKSVVEVYVAPIYPGLHLIYPPIILILLITLLLYLSKIKNDILRNVGALFSILAWAGLGFATIINYYN
ncbi:hypothetical protein [Pelagicoccus sp. SDUM812005]|uniref:hypothetical protein n=1 Tax=Pelagicoccus sp. SDUM812005 TaxID=3041257 RepID=UPI0028104543|nr:hypothetical protein [Pelagicoccus sp. SDUM812005]MDQ8183872.1 hypothetical protein [Pelagicoccus sp. SDUM812005]